MKCLVSLVHSRGNLQDVQSSYNNLQPHPIDTAGEEYEEDEEEEEEGGSSGEEEEEEEAKGVEGWRASVQGGPGQAVGARGSSGGGAGPRKSVQQLMRRFQPVAAAAAGFGPAHSGATQETGVLMGSPSPSAGGRWKQVSLTSKQKTGRMCFFLGSENETETGSGWLIIKSLHLPEISSLQPTMSAFVLFQMPSAAHPDASGGSGSVLQPVKSLTGGAGGAGMPSSRSSASTKQPAEGQQPQVGGEGRRERGEREGEGRRE